MRNRPTNKPPGATTRSDASRDTDLRIIGGHFRGRRLHYHGDPIVRPMKHRVREAIFNLISTESAGRHAIDLFAGTGALGLEALSRGAEQATFIERHVPSAQVLAENIAALGVVSHTTLLVTSAFLWAKRDLPTMVADRAAAQLPWLVFCSPPYDFFVDRRQDMLALIDSLKKCSPPGSTLVVEADERFDFQPLIDDNNWTWDVRVYPPAVVAIGRFFRTLNSNGVNDVD
ncbi:MAG TPA: RsmD family RNA methyltransferase [Lacipirellulaceae bacterium]|jgi:16S rRNA (guanine966-N2)-methyltransferase